MKMEAKTVFATAVFFGSCAFVASSIRCYECNSYLDPECADFSFNAVEPKNNVFLKECGDFQGMPATFCRKLDVTYLASQERRIIRNCGFVQPKRAGEDYCFDADNEGYVEKICQCYNDQCNGASNISNGVVMIFVFIVGFIVLVNI